MELSQEEFQYNLCLRYGMMPQEIPATCNSFRKKFSIKNALSCPKGSFVMARHDNAAKGWGALGSWDLTPSDISYEPQINSKTVQVKVPGLENSRKRVQPKVTWELCYRAKGTEEMD